MDLTAAQRARLLAVWRVALVLVAAILLARAATILVPTLKGYPYDGKVDWIAAQAWLNHVNPYSPEEMHRVKLDGLGHPPSTSFWMLPFGRMELHDAGNALALVVLALVLAQLAALSVELRYPAPIAFAAAAYAVVLTAHWMQVHLALAQISALIAFAYFVAWFYLRRDNEWGAGIALGLACTIKLFPGVMVLFLALTRRWRAVAAAGASYLFVALVMTSRFGLVAWKQYADSEGTIVQYWVGSQSNGALQAIVLRWLVPTCRRISGPRTDASVIALIVSLALLLLVWRLARRAARSTATIDLPFVLFSLLSQFLNPFLFEHYNALMLLPLFVVVAALVQARRQGLSTGRVAACVVALLVIGVCLGLPVNNARGVGTWWGRAAGAHFMMHLAEITNWVSPPILLGVAGALLLWFERRNFAGLTHLAIGEDEK